VKKRKRMLSLLVTLAMVIGLMPGMSLTAYAKSKVKYLDASGAEQSITNYFEVESDTKNLRQGWYVVNSDVEINETFSISEDVNLILCDGAKLTVTSPRDGISAIRGSLTIYAQSTSDNMGKLEVTSTGAGIRLNKNLTINGGKIETQGSYGIFSQEADITINGGNVTADGCIFFSTQNNLTITGGKVIASATGTDSGIYTEGEVIISGGNVSVTGDENPAIGGNVKNSIAGTGWTNKAGTEGRADIAISTGQTLDYKKVQFPAAASHTHNFTYSSDGAVITATCSASGCTLTDNKATLTIVKPTLTTYGETGKSAVATLDGLQAFNTATSKAIAATDIKYIGRDGTTYTESATAPTNAGKYTAKITLSGVKTAEGDDKSVAASVDYSIKYAVTFNTNGGSAVPQQLVEAGESATRPTDPTREGNIFGGWFADADFAKRYVFDEVTENTTVYAKWGEHRVTWTVGEYSLQDVFTGNAPAADSNTMVNLAAEINKPEGATFEGWKTETYVSGDVTHTAQFSFPVTLNVNGGTINAGNVESYIYGTGATLPTDVTRAKYDFGGWYANSELTGTAVTQIGTTATGSKEFWAKWTAVYAVPATVTANNRTYDGTEKPLVTVTGETIGGDLKIAVTKENQEPGDEAYTFDTTSIPTATNAGTYYVWYKAEGDTNHNSTEPDKVEVTVAKATPTVTAPTAKTLIYTGEAQELVTAGSTTGGEMQYSLDGTNYSTTIPKGTEAGNYTVYFKVVGGDNYADTPAASFTVTIAGADAGNTSPAAADKLTYNGEAQKLVTGGSVTGGELRYVLGTDASIAPALDSFKKDIPTGTNAGTYYVWYRVKGDANHNDVAPACIEVKIAKAAIKPEVSITGWTYGQAANAPSVTGNPGNGAVTYTYSDKVDGAFTATVPVNAGTWYVKASVAEIDNYLGGEATLSFAIAKATLTVVAVNQSKVEGDADPQLTYTVTGLVGSDTLTGTLARQPGEDAGTYDITQGTLAASDNYNISFTKGTLTITAKPVSGHVEVETKTGAGVPPMNVAGMTDEFAKKLLTPTELVMMDNGANAHVYVEATNTDGSLSDEIRQRIASALPAGAKIAALMDVSMYKQVGDNPPAKVSGLPAPVTLEFDVSRYGSRTAGMRRTIFVMHFVKGAWRVEGQGAGPTVTVQVNELSPFAIAYVDTPIATPEPTAKPTKAPKPTAEPTAKPTKAPKPTAKPEPKPVKADYTLLAKMTVCGSSKTALKIAWTKVAEADGYDVFFAKCGKDFKLKGSIHGTSVRFTKLSKRAGYKAYVRAWKLEGSGKVYIGKASPEVHAITGGYNAKSCNARDVRLNRSSLKLKVGKSKTIKATVKGVKSGRKLLDHVRLVRWYSSNVNIATVNKNGKVKAVGKGSCTVWAIANNGVRTSVKVTVK